jgi:superfamily I DNA/RNA helicase
MPRINTKTKSRAGKQVNCGRCRIVIQPGQKYRSWSFRYGGTHFRCMQPKCNPRASELTQSQAGQMYQLTERIEDACQAIRTPGEYTIEDFKSEMESIREDAESLKDEIQEGFDNMLEGLQQAEAGQRAEARVEALDSFMDELDSTIDNAEWEVDEEEECKTCGLSEHDPNEKYDHDFKPVKETDPDSEERVEGIVSEFESISLDVE